MSLSPQMRGLDVFIRLATDPHGKLEDNFREFVKSQGDRGVIELVVGLLRKFDPTKPAGDASERVQVLSTVLLCTGQEINPFTDVCEAFNTVLSDNVPSMYLQALLGMLRVPESIKCKLCVVVFASCKPALATQARVYLETLVKDRVKEQKLPDVPPEVLHDIVLTMQNARSEIGVGLVCEMVRREQEKIKAKSGDSSNSLWQIIPLLAATAANQTDSNSAWRQDLGFTHRILSTLPMSVRLEGILRDLGFDSMATPDVLKSVIKSVSPNLTPEVVARVIGMMCTTYGGQGVGTSMSVIGSSLPWSYLDVPSVTEHPSTWNLDVFVSVIKEQEPAMDWRAIASALDYPEFRVPDVKSLAVLFTIFKKARENFPIVVLFDQWKNKIPQFSLLVQCTQAPRELIDFNAIPKDAAQETIVQAFGQKGNNGAWNCYQVYETILGLSASSPTLFAASRELFSSVVNESPELAILTLSRIMGIASPLHTELYQTLLARFLGVPVVPVLKALWHLNSNMFVNAVNSLYASTPAILPTIIRAAMEMEVENELSEDAVPGLGVEIQLAVATKKKDYVSLEKYLNEQLKNKKVQFLKPCLDVVKRKQDLKSDVPPEALVVCFKCLTSFGAKEDLPKELVDELRQSYSESFKMGTPADNVDTSLLEQEAYRILQEMYVGKKQSKETFALLKKLKTSTDAKEKALYGQVVNNLFDEFRFYNKYPEKQLKMTAEIFGSLIREDMLESMMTLAALRYVLEALKEPKSAHYKFGIWSLTEFIDRLPQWPHYCKCLLELPSFTTESPELADKVRAIVKTLDAGGRAAPSNEPSVIAAAAEQDVVVEPVAAVKDKVHFIFNNLSEEALAKRAKELIGLLTAETLPWMTKYVVVKRAAYEPNNHALYISLLEEMSKDPAVFCTKIWRFVIKRTVKYCNVLLQSDKTVHSMEDRTMLKTLGSWLGEITLARNKPLLFSDMYIKGLLLQSYKDNTLLVVLPFVCKVLEACAKSSVFQPPNPWLMGIVRLLIEFHRTNELKTPLQIATELLCQTLGIDMRDVKPTEYLRNGVPTITQFGEIITTGGQPITRQQASVPDQQLGVMGTGLSADALASHLGMTPSQLMENPVLISLLQNVRCTQILPFITPQGDSQLTPAQLQVQLVAIAIDKALRENVTPVIDRTVAIACVTTKDLVTKDFAMDSSDVRLRNAAHNMVQCLASSLALVTCRDPLRNGIVQTVRQSFQQHVTAAGMLAANNQSNVDRINAAIDQVTAQVSQDNLDLAYSLVEQRVQDKAITDIDELLSAAYAVRRKALDHGQKYYDNPGPGTSRFPSSLPSTLVIRPDGLQPVHYQVYDDYRKLTKAVLEKNDVRRDNLVAAPVTGAQQPQPQQPAAQPLPQAIPAVAPAPVHQDKLESMPPAMSAVGTSSDKSVLAQIVEKFSGVLVKLDRSVNKVSSQCPSLSALPSNHEIVVFLNQIPSFISRNVAKREGAVACASVVFKRLLLPDRPDLHREVYVAILDGISRVAQDLAKDITGWVLTSNLEEDYRVHAKSIVHLLRSKLLSPADYMTYLVRALVSNPSRQTFELAVWLADNKVLEIDQTPLVEALRSIASRFTSRPPVGVSPPLQPSKSPPNASMSPAVADLLTRMRLITTGGPLPTPPRPLVHIQDLAQNRYTDLSGDVRQRLLYLLDDWVETFSNPQIPELKALQFFVPWLEEAGLVRDLQTSSLLPFYTEIGIQAIDASATEPSKMYLVIDAVCHLWVAILRGIPHRNMPMKVVESLSKVVVKLCRMLLSSWHKKAGEQTVEVQNMEPVVFPQRAFFRIFVSLLAELTTADPLFDQIHMHILCTFSTALHNLQPNHFPVLAFTWLELVSHNRLMPRLLTAKGEKGWSECQTLLEDLFSFLEPLLVAGLTTEVRALYKGTLRLLLVLLHDFPEFLSENFLSLCNHIPPNCVQLRNLVVSAFPRRMRLPDPFTPNLKVDRLAEMKQVPRISTDFVGMVTAAEGGKLKSDVDNYIRRKTSGESGDDDSLPASLKSRLRLSPTEAAMRGTNYNTALMNALVLYIGTQALDRKDSKEHDTSEAITQSGASELYCRMLVELDDEGRYCFLNGMVNQLRYPNTYTHYFSCMVMYMFAQADKEKFKEDITRVLLERLIVNRPHPWGLLITFIELIRNESYMFWSYSFTRKAPEIQQLFESVARSCGSPQQ